MTVEKRIECLRKTAAAGAAHMPEKPESEGLSGNEFNSSTKREALRLLECALSADQLEQRATA
jgi:hypothetical protein